MNTVPKEGLEPSHPKAQEPKSCVSTSSTTPALFNCFALSADRALEPAYFVVARRGTTPPLAPPQHGGARSGVGLTPALASPPLFSCQNLNTKYGSQILTGRL
jgi:hypothetical protein